MAEFVHLHNHTEYSLLDGLSKIPLLVRRAKELGMNAIALTDHGSLYGAIKFFVACKNEGIKPIIGCEMYMAKRSRLDKEVEHDADYNHLVLLAKNNTGYKNLMKLVSIANLEGFYYKPRIDMEILEKYHEGLIALSGCLNGYFAKELLEENVALAEKKALKLAEIFGEGNFYIELQKHPKIKGQDILNAKLIKLAEKNGLPLVATNDNHYIYKEDAQAQDILLAIQTQRTILDENRPLTMIYSPDFYLRSPEEMAGLFIEYPQAIQNTARIAQMCNVEIHLGKWIMPVFAVPQGLSSAEYLKKIVDQGIKKRYKDVTKEIKDRIDYELGIIIGKGYETYILIVADFVNWAKSRGITVGPGRGSNAGSIISYAIGISDVDPLFFKLPFERFLNPMRPSPPDIDLDFADNRRDEVIAYVTQKYGEDKVAQIITFGTMEARAAVRDTGRALGMPYSDPDRIAKMIPPGWQGHAMTIDMALEQSPDLALAYRSEAETRKLLDLAKKLEGVTRHASVHAAGVVIADKPITEYTPIQREPNGEKIVTQYDMYTVGEDGVGLLKIDFLGLRNLTIIQESLRFIAEKQNIKIDFTDVPLDDKKTYEMLSLGETTGIFQLESTGMRRYIKDLKPTSIFDLQAMVALYRPGPMANIPDFIRRKHNPGLISYPDPRLEDVLKESYGIITFQDDLLLTAIIVAGYSWLEADKLRKAVGKKISSEMKKQHDKFVQGCVLNGMEKNKSEELWILFEPFAGYGFGKAHAACYATIAYRTAYLKANYPVEFMTALLTAESRGASGPTKNEKIALAVSECKRLNIQVFPPDINKSGSEFAIENNIAIRFGLSAIKNVGEAAIETMLLARTNGEFKSFDDFCKRVDLSKVNRKTLESLIKSGAMDKFGKRAELLINLPETIEKLHKQKKQIKEGQSSLFGDDEYSSPRKSSLSAIDDFLIEEKLAFEKEFLGLYLTSHPQLENLSLLNSVITHAIDILSEETEGTRVKTGGIIEAIKRIITKKSGKEMAFLNLGNENGLTVECVIFPKIYDQYKNLLIKDTVIIVEGRIDTKNEKPVVIVEKILTPKHLSS